MLERLIGAGAEKMLLGSAQQLIGDIAAIKAGNEAISAGLTEIAAALRQINENIMVLAIGNERVPGQKVISNQLRYCVEKLDALAASPIPPEAGTEEVVKLIPHDDERQTL